jgi:polysaccharide export outer membrane protein
VIFRRAEDWRLLSTVLDLRGTHFGQRPDPSDQIWLRDSDLIIVPPMPIKVFDDFVAQVFTRGIYGIVPFTGVSFQIQN